MSSQSIAVNYHGEMLVITYDYSPPCKGHREAGTGLPLEPDDPEEIDITSVIWNNQNVWDLLYWDYKSLETLILEERAKL